MLKATGLHGSSGVKKIKSPKEIRANLGERLPASSNLYVEPYIEGKDIVMSLMGEERPFPLPSVEICHGGDFFSFNLKREAFTLRIPAAIDNETEKRLRSTAIKVFYALSGHGILRIDFRLASDGTPYVLEAVPFAEGMSPNHFSSRSAFRLGISFPMLLLKQIEFANSRRNRKDALH